MNPNQSSTKNARSQHSLSHHSVSQYIEGLRAGDELAAQRTWERFVDQLIRLAARKLKGRPGRAEDEEDVVQRAFTQFFQQVQEGRFPKLSDRDDLWQVLCMLVDRRAKDQIKKHNAQKHGGGQVRGESIWVVPDHSQAAGIDGVPGPMLPADALADGVTDALRDLLNGLDSDQHRQVAVLKMQGFTNKEIAEQVGPSLRTVERWLGEIRKVLQTDLNDE